MNPRAGYLQARVQARFGGLPDEALWRHLEPVRDLAGYLAEARSTALGPWVAGLGPSSGVDRIEATLEQQLERLADECAGWIGIAWRAAFDWLRLLPRLPAIEAARLAGTPPGDPAARELGLLAARSRSLSDAWLAGWRRRLPRLGRRADAGVRELERVVSRHVACFAQLRPRDAWAERSELDRHLRLLFRRGTLLPVAAFCLLALALLQTERLRAALLARALFVARPVEG